MDRKFILLAAGILWTTTQHAGVALAAGPPAAAGVVTSVAELRGKVREVLRPGEGILYLTPYLAYNAVLQEPVDNVRITHIVPVVEQIGVGELEKWKQAVPVPVESAELAGGGIVARWGKVGIEVAGVARMPRFASRPVVVLHPDFFIPLYENEVRGGLVDLSLRLYRTLADRDAVGGPLFLLDPLSVPTFPLKWAYLGDLWKDLWRNPEAFRSELPEKWRLRKEAEGMAGFGQFEEASGLLEQARRYFPGDGSVEFQLSGLSFMDRDVPAGLRHLNRAYKIDRRFLRGYREVGAAYLSRDEFPEAEMVLRAGLSVAPEDPELNLALMNLLADRAGALKPDDPEGARKWLEEALTLRVPEEKKKEARDRFDRAGTGASR